MKRAIARLASSTTLNFASRGSLAQSHPTIDPSIISDENMAWLLVDAVKSCLTGYERTIVFVELGCGESYLVIKRILTALLSTRMALSVAILSKLTGWLDGYAGSPEEPQLRMMLAVIRLQQFEAVEVGPARAIGLESSTVQSPGENRREKSSGKCRHVSWLDSPAQLNETFRLHAFEKAGDD